MTSSRLKSIFNLLYEILSTAVIIFALLLAVLYLFGIRMYHVKTGSMGKALPEGSLCFVNTRSSFDKIEVGNVISFRVNEDMLVTHRAIEIVPEGIRTKGDENEIADNDPVTKENYLGKTVFYIPKIGRAISFFHTVKGVIILIAAALLLIVSGFFYKKEKPRNVN